MKMLTTPRTRMTMAWMNSCPLSPYHADVGSLRTSASKYVMKIGMNMMLIINWMGCSKIAVFIDKTLK